MLYSWLAEIRDLLWTLGTIVRFKTWPFRSTIDWRSMITMILVAFEALGTCAALFGFASDFSKLMLWLGGG